MKIALVTDAWEPQVNGVVRTLKNTARELKAMGHTVEFITPLQFRTIPCPTYPDIRLSLFPRRHVTRRLADFDPDAIHLSTEGPLGLAARHYAMATDTPFTTAYHTRFPEYIRARVCMPLSWSYAFLRWFHGPSRAVMAPTLVVKRDLEAWGFRNVVLWSRGVDLDIFRPMKVDRLKTEPPIFLYVGRVAVEKNIDAFLGWTCPARNGSRARGPRSPASAHAIRASISWACSGRRTWPRSTPRRTSSCSPARLTRSAWCCWKPWPADCRWRPIP